MSNSMDEILYKIYSQLACLSSRTVLQHIFDEYSSDWTSTSIGYINLEVNQNGFKARSWCIIYLIDNQ